MPKKRVSPARPEYQRPVGARIPQTKSQRQLKFMRFGTYRKCWGCRGTGRCPGMNRPFRYGYPAHAPCKGTGHILIQKGDRNPVERIKQFYKKPHMRDRTRPH